MFARIKRTGPRNFVVEILMIVIGISIALWFEGLYEERQEREAERSYLEGLAEDLRTDLAQLDLTLAHSEAKVRGLQEIIPGLQALAEAPPETQAQTVFAPSSYHFFEPANVTYLSMRESGDFRLLSQPLIKESLLSLMRRYDQITLMQENFLQAIDDGYIPLVMGGFDLVEFRITDPGLLDDQKFRNFYVYTLQDIGQRLETLKSARRQAAELLEAIETQLG